MAKATEVHESGESSGSLIDLWRTPGLWQMTLNIYFLWFVNSFVYYGLSYNTNEMAGDPFVNFALCGAVEFPAYFLTIFAIRYWGRKNPLSGSMIIGGLACLLVYPLPAEPVWLGVTVSMIGKFCITCSFSIAYVFTAEIFPTVVRNIGVGSASVFARVASILAPFVRELGHATHPFVPQVFFGVLAFAAGILVFLLPETNNVSVPETLAEAASRGKSKQSKISNGHHVMVKLSDSEVDNGVTDDVGVTVVASSPKLKQNGKKLDDVPEEECHTEANGSVQQEPKPEQPAEVSPLTVATAPDVTVDIESPEAANPDIVDTDVDEKTNL